MDRLLLIAVRILLWTEGTIVVEIFINICERLSFKVTDQLLVARGLYHSTDVVHLPGDRRLASSTLSYHQVIFAAVVFIVVKSFFNFFFWLLDELVRLLNVAKLGLRAFAFVSCESDLILGNFYYFLFVLRVRFSRWQGFFDILSPVAFSWCPYVFLNSVRLLDWHYFGKLFLEGRLVLKFIDVLIVGSFYRAGCVQVPILHVWTFVDLRIQVDSVNDQGFWGRIKRLLITLISINAFEWILPKIEVLVDFKTWLTTTIDLLLVLLVAVHWSCIDVKFNPSRFSLVNRI